MTKMDPADMTLRLRSFLPADRRRRLMEKPWKQQLDENWGELVILTKPTASSKNSPFQKGTTTPMSTAPHRNRHRCHVSKQTLDYLHETVLFKVYCPSTDCEVVLCVVSQTSGNSKTLCNAVLDESIRSTGRVQCNTTQDQLEFSLSVIHSLAPLIRFADRQSLVAKQ